MIQKLPAFITALCFLSQWATAGEHDTHVYELRIYYSPPGKLDDLHARFRDHTTKLFEKHGMTNVGYWVPVDNRENKLIYILAFPNAQAREQSWKAFGADSEWQRVRKQTESAGPIVSRVESRLMSATDYSPPVKPARDGGRVFELRVYTATKGNLENLNSRFRDHTLKLFERHGMTNVGYWTPIQGQKGAGENLIYILAHRSVDAAKASFVAFRQDREWLEAKKASEDKAGGSLTVKDGVQSTFLKATDYSPMQ
jgi:hypothetical protein